MEINKLTSCKALNELASLKNLSPIKNENNRNIEFNPTFNILQTADSFYKSSKLLKSWKLAENIIQTVSEEKSYNFNDAFYLSWALHLKGNILGVIENHRLAYRYYKKSLDIKEELNSCYNSSENQQIWGLVFYSYYKTYLKKTALSLSLRSDYNGKHLTHDLENQRVEIEEKKEIINSCNLEYYGSLINSLEYCLGKVIIYDDESDNDYGLLYLNKSKRLSKKLGDYPAQIRATTYISALKPKQKPSYALKVIEDMLKLTPTFLLNSPILKSLIGAQHLIEYDVAKEMDGFGEQLLKLFNRYGVTAHTIDVKTLFSTR